MEKEFFTLARLGLSGRRQDVSAYLRRLLRKEDMFSPAIRQKFADMLSEDPNLATPTRGSVVAAVPVDQDTRLSLLRHESPVVLGVEPVWEESLAAKLHQFVAERVNQSQLLSAGLAPSKSLLFTGRPGVGKTLAARWIAEQLKLPLFTLDLSTVMSSFLGKTGINLRHVLDYAKGTQCVLLLDEIDAIAKKRDDDTEIGELKRLVSVLIQEMDDWPDSGVLISATNHPDLLDPAIWRRFDLVLEFPLPTRTQTKRAISTFLSRVVPEDGCTLDLAADILVGRSYNDIERTVLNSRRKAVLSGRSFLECFLEQAKANISLLNLSQRKELAAKLVKDGHTQAEISDITSLSRPTIRKIPRSIKSVTRP